MNCRETVNVVRHTESGAHRRSCCSRTHRGEPYRSPIDEGVVKFHPCRTRHRGFDDLPAGMDGFAGPSRDPTESRRLESAHAAQRLQRFESMAPFGLFDTREHAGTGTLPACQAVLDRGSSGFGQGIQVGTTVGSRPATDQVLILKGVKNSGDGARIGSELRGELRSTRLTENTDVDQNPELRGRDAGAPKLFFENPNDRLVRLPDLRGRAYFGDLLKLFDQLRVARFSSTIALAHITCI